MKKYRRFLYLLCVSMFLSSCSSATVAIDGNQYELQIDKQATKSYLEKYSAHDDPHEGDYNTSLANLAGYQYGEKMIAAKGLPPETEIKVLDTLPDEDNYGYDVRDKDVSAIDLSSVTNYNKLTFSTNTIWPDKLPEGFDPDYFLEYNKNPGLGIRALHEKGITGEGVGVAIVDMALLLDHQEYRDRLMYYEELHLNPGFFGDKLHGAAVSGIAVGESVGVAPGSKLYFIGKNNGHYVMDGEYFVDFEIDWSLQADAVNRIVELNRKLPETDKIRVISISSNSFGTPGEKGYEEMIAAVERADSDNIFVMAGMENAYYDFGINFGGMYRNYSDDPDDFASYRPSDFWSELYYSNYHNPRYATQRYLFVPQGSRTLAWYKGAEEYMLSSFGGTSWAIPWLAGFYALCCQVKPDITPHEFVQVVMDTGITTDYTYNDSTMPFGNIVNPEATINELMKR